MPPRRRNVRKNHESSKGGETPELAKDSNKVVKEATSTPSKRGRGKRKASDTLLEANEGQTDNDLKLSVEKNTSPGFSCKRILRSSLGKDLNIDICSDILQPKKRSRTVKPKNTATVEESSTSTMLLASNLETEDEVKMLEESGIRSPQKNKRFVCNEVTRNATVHSLDERRSCLPSCTVTDISLTAPDEVDHHLIRNKMSSVNYSTDTATGALDQFDSTSEQICLFDERELEPNHLLVKTFACEQVLDRNAATETLKTVSDSQLYPVGTVSEHFVLESPSVNNSRNCDFMLNFERMSSKNLTDCLMFESEEDFKPDYDEDDKPDLPGSVSKRIMDCRDFRHSSHASPFDKCIAATPSLPKSDLKSSELVLSTAAAMLDVQKPTYVEYLVDQKASSALGKLGTDNSVLFTVESKKVEIGNVNKTGDSQVMSCHSLDSQFSAPKISGIGKISEHSPGTHTRTKSHTKKSDVDCIKGKVDEDLKAVQVQISPENLVSFGSSNLAEIPDIESGISGKQVFMAGVVDVLQGEMEKPEVISEKPTFSAVESTRPSVNSLLPESSQTLANQIFKETRFGHGNLEGSLKMPILSEDCGYRKTDCLDLLEPKIPVSPTVAISKAKLHKAPEATVLATAEISGPRIRLKRPWRTNNKAEAVAIQSSVISKTETHLFAAVGTSEPKLEAVFALKSSRVSVEAVSSVQNNRVSVEAVSSVQNSPVSVNAVSSVQNSPVSVNAVSSVQNNRVSVEAVSSVQNSPVSVKASVALNPSEDDLEDLLEGDASPSEDECFDEMRSSSSVMSGTGNKSFSLAQPQSERQCEVQSSTSKLTCSNITLPFSSPFVKEVTEKVNREELKTVCKPKGSSVRTTEFIEELVVEDYASDFDDDPCESYVASPMKDVHCVSESHFMATETETDAFSNEEAETDAFSNEETETDPFYNEEAETDAFSNEETETDPFYNEETEAGAFSNEETETDALSDEMASGASGQLQQSEQYYSRKHDNQFETQVPSSGEVCDAALNNGWFPITRKTVCSSVGSGSNANASINLGRKRNVDRSLKHKGSPTAIPSLFDIRPKVFSQSKSSGFLTRQCNANKNSEATKSYNSELSDDQIFRLIKTFTEDEDWKSLVDLFLSTNQRRFCISYFAQSFLDSSRDIGQGFEKLMVQMEASTGADGLSARKQIIGVIGISLIEKCLDSGHLSDAFEVLAKMLERKIHFFLSASHTESASNIVKTAVDVFMSQKQYDMVSLLLTEFDYFRCHSDVKRGNVGMPIERKYCCLNAVLVEIHRHLINAGMVTIGDNKIPLCKTGITVLTEILEDWENDVKLHPGITQLIELSNVLDLLVSGCICQRHSSGLMHLSVLQERHPDYLDWKTPTIHAIVDFFLKLDLMNLLLSDEQPISFVRLAFEHNLLPKLSEYVPFKNNVLTLWPNLSSVEMKLVICAYMKSILQEIGGSNIMIIPWRIHLADSAVLSRTRTSIENGMATLQKVLSSNMTPPLQWTMLSPSCLCFESCSLADIRDILFNFGITTQTESCVYSQSSFSRSRPEIVLETGDVDLRRLTWNKEQSIAEPNANASKLLPLLSIKFDHKCKPTISEPSLVGKPSQRCAIESKSNNYSFQEFSEQPHQSNVSYSALKSLQSSATTRMECDNVDGFSRNLLQAAGNQILKSSPQASGDLSKQSNTFSRKVLLKTPQTIQEMPQLFEADASVYAKIPNLNIPPPPIPWQNHSATKASTPTQSLPTPLQYYGTSFSFKDIKSFSSIVSTNQQFRKNVGNTTPISCESLTPPPQVNAGASNEPQSSISWNKNFNRTLSRDGTHSRFPGTSSDFVAKSIQQDQRFLLKDKKEPDLVRSRTHHRSFAAPKKPLPPFN